ncbi:DUF4062 domain-containing protein [Devosia sp. XK-2]|uniref:DUF4062 domain-containing protein n=1 Tax=Devosia sp. XK-2 TaxID=3126689 RepID=UPI0030D0221A
MIRSKNRKLQVFVSSTFTDLRDERQAAVEAILKSGHIPAGMELFTSGDQSQMDVIKKWIDESDVYLLILGGRYGSIEDSTQISYTELEYNYALDKNVPLFSLVLSERWVEEKVKLQGLSMTEGVAPLKLKAFREKVLTKLSAFVDDEKDIKLSVYESLADFADDARVIGWVRADTAGDITKLNTEISALREENSALQKRLEEVNGEKINSSSKAMEEQDAILKKILSSIKLTVPAEAAGGKSFDTNAYKCAYDNRDAIITGVFNEYGMHEGARFLYFTLLPKLQAHGLADNERIPGKPYRRYFLNKEGQSFFAREERRRLLAEETSVELLGKSVDDEQKPATRKRTKTPKVS